jgi:MoxR-like ATPase
MPTTSPIDRLHEARDRILEQLSRVIVGQADVIEELLICLFSRGHCLLEGVPGLAKTLLVSTLARSLDLTFSRIQFTPDLMPADIVGTDVLEEDRATGVRQPRFLEGPVFANVVLADEINRTPPKTQAALLEAMQEGHVSVGRVRHRLVDPFFVLATQNPIEQEGTYPLPEAQLDRFLLKVSVPNVERADLMEILRRTTTSAEPAVDAVLDGARIVEAQRLARRIVIAAPVQDYVIRLVLATHPGGDHADERAAREIAVGASPRAAQAIVTAAKVRALFDGRFHVSIGDVHAVAPAALRHRVIPSFEAEADGLDTDRVVAGIIDRLPRHAPEEAA